MGWFIVKADNICFLSCLRTGRKETATWSHCQLFQFISICTLRWGTDICRAAVGLINTTKGIIILPICVRAPKDDTTAAPEKELSVKPGSKHRTKCYSANKTAVVLSVMPYKKEIYFLSMNVQSRFQIWRPWQIYIKFLIRIKEEVNWAERCQLVLFNIWRPVHRVSLEM